MRFAALRTFALSLPEVVESPHHDFTSFRIRGKIFVTAPPPQDVIHVFVSEAVRERALVVHAGFAEKLLWGGKVVGLRIRLAAAEPATVKDLVRQAWLNKAPRSLHGSVGRS